MVRDPFGDEEEPDLQDVLDALDDEDCRRFIRALDEPMTARELSDACDVPLSTTYRKLELLTEASLFEEQTRIRPDGQHTNQYVVEFEEVRVLLEENRTLSVRIDRPARAPEQRLADMWSEVRKET